jgi:TolB-like protein
MTNEINFGRFSLDLARGGLLRDGKPVPLGNRALDILVILASANGEIVTKDQLMAQVWPGRVVEENNIQVHVSALRKALDDGSTTGSCVVTVPGRGYRLVAIPSPASVDRAAAEPVSEAAEYPSIAVLPFQNMSDDPDQDHFTDGIVEEIITGLSRFRWLSIVARNSSFAYRGRAIDVRQIGRELGARFILEGSVRKTGDRVRITSQLIDTATGTHVWADHFDGGLEHAFDLQDQVTASVVGAIEPTVLRVEGRRATRKLAATAWEHVAQRFAVQRRLTREDNAEALQIFRQAIKLDPDLGSAYALASQCYTWAKSFGWFTDPAAESAEGARLARRALDLGRDDAGILTAAGFGLAYLQGDLDVATDAIARARALNPNSPAALGPQGWIHVWRGEPELALADVERALQLSPADLFAFAWWCVGAYAHFTCGRYDDALSWAERTWRERPGYLPSARMIVASAALGGRPQSSEMSLARLRQLDPMLRLSNLQEQMPFRRAGDLARLTDGLRKAGLPE